MHFKVLTLDEMHHTIAIDKTLRVVEFVGFTILKSLLSNVTFTVVYSFVTQILMLIPIRKDFLSNLSGLKCLFKLENINAGVV